MSQLNEGCYVTGLETLDTCCDLDILSIPFFFFFKDCVWVIR